MSTVKKLRELVADAYFTPLIKQITRCPFQIYFNWPEQESFWKQYSVRLNFFIILNAVKLNINLRNLDGLVDSNIVLYQLLGDFHDHTTPFFQVIANTTDTEFFEKNVLKYILGEWLRLNVSASKFMQIDFPSRIFFEAASEVLNHRIIFERYIDDCFLYLKGDVKSEPNCILKVNLFSFVKYLKNTNYFDKVNDDEIISELIKEFFIKCVVLLSNISNFELFKKTIIYVFILLKSEIKNDFVTEAIKFIDDSSSTMFKNFTIMENNYKENYNINYSPFFICNEKSNYLPGKTFYFLKELTDSALLKCTMESGKMDEEANLLSSKILYNKFLRLLAYFPVWSNIVKKKENYELDEFKILKLNYINQNFNYNMKKKVFESGAILEADDFIKNYASFLKDICQKNRNSDLWSSDEIGQTDAGYVHSYFRHQDNWKGKNIIVEEEVEENEQLVDLNADNAKDLLLSHKNTIGSILNKKGI